jgi:hypothetical protein
VRSCPLLCLLKGLPRRHSTDEASLWGQTHSQEEDEPSRRDTRNASVEDAAPLPLRPILFPAAEVNNRWAPVAGIVSIKGDMCEGKQAGLYLSLERCSCPCPSYSFIASCNNFLPLPLEDVYNERTDTELFLETRGPRGIAPMHEPTQEFIVSELRRRMSVSIAELTQVLGLQFASVLPQEIQRMKDSGLVVYDEPLGPSSLLSLPR